MNQRLSFAILFLLLSFPSASAVLFTPALPSIVSFFQLSSAQSDLTLSTYLIGYALGQLPYGPLANRFGRKKTLYIGLSISIVGCLLCAASSFFVSFPLLVFARFLQALGACVGLKVSFTMIADSYDEMKGAKMISLLGTGFAIVPAIAMMIGGYLTKNYAWESCFYFLAIFGGVVLWLSMQLPETSKKLTRDALRIPKIIEGYTAACKNKPLMFSGLIIGLGTAISYIFNAKAPFIAINLLGLSPDMFGMYSLIPLLGMLVGSFLSHRLAGSRSLIRVLLIGSIVSLSGALFMLLLFASEMGSVASLFLPMFLIYMIDSVIFSNISSFGLARAQDKANGSAILHFVSLSTAAIFMFSIRFSSLDVELLMPVSFVLLLCMTFVLCFGLRGFTVSQGSEQSPPLEKDQDQL